MKVMLKHWDNYFSTKELSSTLRDPSESLVTRNSITTIHC